MPTKEIPSPEHIKVLRDSNNHLNIEENLQRGCTSLNTEHQKKFKIVEKGPKIKIRPTKDTLENEYNKTTIIKPEINIPPPPFKHENTDNRFLDDRV